MKFKIRMLLRVVVFLLAIGKVVPETKNSVAKEEGFYESLLKELVTQNVKLTEKLSELESDVNMLKGSLKKQENVNKKQTDTIKRLKKKLDHVCGRLSLNSTPDRSTIMENTDSVAGKEDSPKPLSDSFANHIPNRIKRQDEHVAFSAYVDHEVRHMGKDQIVQFQNIILNDGNGYNKYTGIFTVPTDGVYLLTYFVEDYHRFQSIFHMVVDRSIVTSAIIEPAPQDQNVQGGNVIMIRLKAGNSVWVTTGTGGDNIEGYGLLRTSTFSGYLIYQ